MLSIGKPIQSPTAQNAVAWEFAYQLKTAPDNVFMNISEKEGKELYDMARDKGSLLFKKLTDQGDTTRSDFCNYYLPKYAHKTFVDGETVEKFLGLYSLVHTMRVFTASIIFITNELTSYEAVLCVAGGQNRPTYIFDATQGTLQQVTNLYDSIFEYVPEGSHIMAYIVSSDSMPIVMQKAETPAKKRDDEKEEEETPKKKKAVPAKKREEKEVVVPEKKRERSEEEEAEETEPKKKKAVPKKKVIPEDSSSDKKTTTPSSSGKKKKKEDQEDQEEVEKPKKKPVVRRKRIAETE